MALFEREKDTIKVNGVPVGVIASNDEVIEAFEYVIKNISSIPQQVIEGRNIRISASEEAMAKYRVSAVEASFSTMRRKF